MHRGFRRHELVVYEKAKHGTHPGPRARNVRPAVHGDTYVYTVDKYWIVVEAVEGRPLVLRTPAGKLHEIDASDPRLRRPTWRERLWLRIWGRQRLGALLGHDA